MTQVIVPNVSDDLVEQRAVAHSIKFGMAGTCASMLVSFVEAETSAFRAKLAAAEEWRRNQQINWPMEIERLNRLLAAAEAKLEDEEANAARAWNAWETVTSRLEIARKALELLHLQQRGRAKALRLLNEARSISDPATLAQADAYEECGNELREALRSLNPDVAQENNK